MLPYKQGLDFTKKLFFKTRCVAGKQYVFKMPPLLTSDVFPPWNLINSFMANDAIFSTH